MPEGQVVLHRVRGNDGEVYDMMPANLWDARRNVAWCLVDNAQWSQEEADKVALNLTLSSPLVTGFYTWTLVTK
jgi:hypothetical protein